MGGVVVEGHGGEVGVGKLEVGHIGAVDLELELVAVTENGEGGGVRRSEVLDGMVEVELLHLRAGRDGLLGLRDEHILGLGGENLALLSIEVGVVGVDIPLEAVVRGVGTPRDAELDIVVLERDEREGGLPVLTEGEPERVEPLRGGTGVETTGDRLGGRGRRESGGDEGRVDRVLLIDELTTDEKLYLLDDRGPIGDGLGRGTVVGYEIDIVEHVTLALEADGGHTVVRDVALNDLTLDSLGKVRMTLVCGTEKADFGLTDEVHILSTDSDKLGDTTRHLYYMETLFLSRGGKVDWDRRLTNLDRDL